MKMLQEILKMHHSRNLASQELFYCCTVLLCRTIVAPCGVVIAWTKFAKSESPTKILNFLERVFDKEESHPAYICIDKACVVLRSAISNSWNRIWEKTTRFIVDTYHYKNHSKDDVLCQEWCNPAPTDGSAPNLVVAACEQFNSWLGGFESILKLMTPQNFNWFLHSMIIYHSKYVIQKKKQHTNAKKEKDSETSEEEDVDADVEG
ncbi:hypothetical protein BDQ12DRAFT_698975 [Crucibulum laeve]|uniref:MULE transposase domain-containing protein n=1 Tax=Crucibulum laeve TaxID=68775 RepID=A0A5C3LYW6_9AGAR|nr:hypothetical protein BDQ12DRAFT_698975 [Crucibulum laeve]